MKSKANALRALLVFCVPSCKLALFKDVYRQPPVSPTKSLAYSPFRNFYNLRKEMEQVSSLQQSQAVLVVFISVTALVLFRFFFSFSSTTSCKLVQFSGLDKGSSFAMKRMSLL